MRRRPLSVALAAIVAAAGVGLGWAAARSCAPGGSGPTLARDDAAHAAPPTRAELESLQRSAAEHAATIRALVDELALLRADVAALAGALPRGADVEDVAGGADAPGSEDAELADAAASDPPPDGLPAARPAFDAAGLVAAGFPAREAERVHERWERLTLDRLELNNRALREGWLRDPRLQDEHRALDAAFREDVGEDGYDAFLYATGQPNRVRVKEVIARSPASHAGLEPGDLIVRYDGARTFGARDLQVATAQGRRGDLVRVEVVRDGRALTLRVERGPLGIILQGSAEPPRSAS